MEGRQWNGLTELEVRKNCHGCLPDALHELSWGMPCEVQCCPAGTRFLAVSLLGQALSAGIGSREKWCVWDMSWCMFLLLPCAFSFTALQTWTVEIGFWPETWWFVVLESSVRLWTQTSESEFILYDSQPSLHLPCLASVRPVTEPPWGGKITVHLAI